MVNVLVTGVSGGGVGRQCIKALRLGKHKYQIITCDTNPLSLGLHHPSCDKNYLVPSSLEKSYISTLLAISVKEKIQVIIPGSEAELLVISQNKQVFINNNILVLANTKSVIETCLNKKLTIQTLHRLGFKTPKSYIPKNYKDTRKNIHFPVVVKPFTCSGGSRGVFLAQNQKELKFFIEYLSKQGSKVIVQEYVGDANNEYTVGVLHSLKGQLLGSFALKRIVKGALSIKSENRDYNNPNISYVISTGISQGEANDFPDIRKQCEKIAKALNSKGPLNIQCRIVNNEIYVFEINPRFSGTSSMRALCGFNEPETLIDLHILGKKPKVMNYKSGFILRDLDNLFISPNKIKQIEKLDV